MFLNEARAEQSETCVEKHRQSFIYESHNGVRGETRTQKSVSGATKVAGFARGWDFSWWRLECKALVCVLLFHSFSLAHF